MLEVADQQVQPVSGEHLSGPDLRALSRRTG
jgi:hypothetical protein